MYVPISLCVKRIFKVVYRQVFCKCVRLMQRVLYYSTTSNWSVCKSVYIILATTTLRMNYMRLIYKYYPAPFLSYSLRSGTTSKSSNIQPQPAETNQFVSSCGMCECHITSNEVDLLQECTEEKSK